MSDIIEKARSIARNITYNESAAEAAAKHIIFELCAELEAVRKRESEAIQERNRAVAEAAMLYAKLQARPDIHAIANTVRDFMLNLLSSELSTRDFNRARAVDLVRVLELEKLCGGN